MNRSAIAAIPIALLTIGSVAHAELPAKDLTIAMNLNNSAQARFAPLPSYSAQEQKAPTAIETQRFEKMVLSVSAGLDKKLEEKINYGFNNKQEN